MSDEHDRLCHSRAGVATIHALYISLVVKPQSVMAASRTYARQLTLSCETFITGQKPPRIPANRKGNAA